MARRRGEGENDQRTEGVYRSKDSRGIAPCEDGEKTVLSPRLHFFLDYQSRNHKGYVSKYIMGGPCIVNIYPFYGDDPVKAGERERAGTANMEGGNCRRTIKLAEEKGREGKSEEDEEGMEGGRASEQEVI